MTSELRQLIRRCQFLQLVYSDLGQEFDETKDHLLKDIGRALVALEEGEESQKEAIELLKNWV